MDISDIKYAIPSYQRAKLLRNSTIKLLESAGIEEVDLYINENELEEYQNILATPTEIPLSIIINYKTINFNGIGRIRNHIRNQYPHGTNLIMIDDDIEDILIQDNGKLVGLENIIEFNESMFLKCEEIGAYLWSVQLYNNPYFLKKDYVQGLTYINGSWTGLRINHNLKDIRVDINHFEDYLFSILHFIRDKNVLKAGNVCLKTRCFNPNGGICKQLGGFDKRQQQAFKNSKKLFDTFSKLMDIKQSLKYDVANIRLKNVKWRKEYEILADIYCKNYSLSIYNDE